MCNHMSCTCCRKAVKGSYAAEWYLDGTQLFRAAHHVNAQDAKFATQAGWPSKELVCLLPAECSMEPRA